jgi:hypothetical protein
MAVNCPPCHGDCNQGRTCPESLNATRAALGLRATCSPGHCAGSETCLRSLCINHPSNHCGGGIPLHPEPAFHETDGGHRVSGDDSLRLFYADLNAVEMDPPMPSPAQVETWALLVAIVMGCAGLIALVVHFSR